MKFKSLIFIAFVLFGSVAFFACGSANNKSEAEKLQLVKVLTYNIRHCNPPNRGDTIDLEQIAQVIAEQQADIVALQEVDLNTRRSGEVNQARQLAKKAGFPAYYFGQAMDYDGGQYGVLILSKFPLSSPKTYALPMSGMITDEPRILAVVTVMPPEGKPFLFGATHLEAYSKESAAMQALEIAHIADTTTLPFIVAGDFNAQEGDEVLQLFDRLFGRSCKACPPTFVADGTAEAIDFIVFRPKERFKVIRHEVIENHLASDHFPVKAELGIISR